MNPVAFVIAYARWHYGSAILDILRVWGNFLWVTLHFFSTGTLVTTLFSPFLRLKEDYPEKGHFDPGFYFGSMFVNMMMRIVGFFVRGTFIIISLTGFSIIFVLGFIFLVLWITAPVALTSFITVGLDLIFTA